jgi:hypothetical protein
MRSALLGGVGLSVGIPPGGDGGDDRVPAEVAGADGGLNLSGSAAGALEVVEPGGLPVSGAVDLDPDCPDARPENAMGRW